MASYTNSLAPSLGNTMGPLICMKVRHVEICIAQIYGYKPQIGMDSIWNGFCFKNTFRSLQNGARILPLFWKWKISCNTL